MPRDPIRISIIVPVYNSPLELYECLSALLAPAHHELEILVVDDASTDATPTVATQMGVRVLQLAENAGPAAARNYGARHARGEILFFVDADVVVAPGAIDHVLTLFEEHYDVAAVFGSYDASPRAKGIVSQYRNLLHHFVHQNGNSKASTFWAGCGAIRRSVFEAIGGFDEKRFPRPSIEDIDLGYRLRKAGYRILLDKALQGTHLKQWTLRSIIQTDICNRALPWARLILESRHIPNDLNLKLEQRLSGVLVMLAALFLLLSVVRVELFAFSVAALFSVVVLNRKLYLFFFQKGGLHFAAMCLPLHFLYYLYSGLSYLYVRIGFQLIKVHRWIWPLSFGEESNWQLRAGKLRDLIALLRGVIK
ncbi:MAG TPA: glycosyltransferase family 2 protein [Candidatus Hypogeohydataceae bacterium YC41]